MKILDHDGKLLVTFPINEYRNKLRYEIRELEEELQELESYEIKTQKQEQAQMNLCELFREYDLIESPVPDNQSWIVRSKLRYARFNNLIKVMRKAGIDILIFRDRNQDGISVKVCNRDGITPNIRAIFGNLADKILPMAYETEGGPYAGFYNGTERYLFHIKPKPGAKYEEAWKVLVARKAAERKAERAKARSNSKRVTKKRDRKK